MFTQTGWGEPFVPGWGIRAAEKPGNSPGYVSYCLFPGEEASKIYRRLLRIRLRPRGLHLFAVNTSLGARTSRRRSQQQPSFCYFSSNYGELQERCRREKEPPGAPGGPDVQQSAERRSNIN